MSTQTNTMEFPQIGVNWVIGNNIAAFEIACIIDSSIYDPIPYVVEYDPRNGGIMEIFSYNLQSIIRLDASRSEIQGQIINILKTSGLKSTPLIG